MIEDEASAPSALRATAGGLALARSQGSTMLTGSSSSLKIRSDEAIAACRMLNFSDMSEIGRKKRCRVQQERDERARASASPGGPQPPPNQIVSAAASALMTSIAG